MGLIDFVKSAGEKIFGGDDEPEVQNQAQTRKYSFEEIQQIKLIAEDVLLELGELQPVRRRNHDHTRIALDRNYQPAVLRWPARYTKHLKQTGTGWRSTEVKD